MAQIFPRSANALARMSIVLVGLFVATLGGAVLQFQRSPWVTRQGERLEQPVPFSHQHHVSGLGLDCRLCHTSVENSSFAGIPPTKTCMNCHSQIWTNAPILEPVRASFRENKSLVWTRTHDLPDFVYFSHEIHINKGVGCASCHGPVDEMPLMYQYGSLQMEWCLDCHRNPAKNLRPREAIFNMRWTAPTAQKPVFCSDSNNLDVKCASEEAMLPALTTKARVFKDQTSLGQFLVDRYRVRTPYEITSCETCHR